MKTLFTLLLTTLISFPAIAGETPAVGEPAPGFKLQDQNGEWHDLMDYRGTWLAVYFYPRDQTPGCTTEACKFRDDIFKFRAMGTYVIGVSLDDESSHKKFADKYSLPFPLLADSDGMTASAYGVKRRFLGLSIAKRQTFLIDPQGRIAKHYEDVDPDTHSAELLADLAELTGIPAEQQN